MTPFLDTHAVNSAGASKLWSVYLFRFRTSIPDFVVLNSKNFKMVRACLQIIQVLKKENLLENYRISVDKI